MFTPILSIFQNQGTDFKGEFRISAFNQRLSSSKKRYLKFTFEDATGTVDGFLWDDKFKNLTWQKLDAVRVEGRSRKLGDGVVVDIERLEDLWLDSPVSSTRLLPRKLCFEPMALDRLLVIIDHIQNAHLLNFCNYIFEDLSIAIPFIQNPASVKHHHSMPGGLILHSVEVAELVMKDDSLHSIEKDIAIVGALFHDIGKIHTLSLNKRNSLYLDHDLLTLEVVSGALKNLDKASPELANELRHIWTFRCMRSGTGPLTPAAHAVLNADRVSAANDK